MNEKKIGKPKNGWEQNCWYLVEVAYSESNLIHRSLFYSGFLREQKPAGYNGFVNSTYDEDIVLTFKDAYHLKVIKKILDELDMRMIK